MVATVTIREKTGAGETATDKTSGTIRFKNADDATVDSNNPMVIPGAGSDYSFEKWLRLNVSGTYTQLDNFNVYTDGTLGWGTGCTVYIKTTNPGAFTQPAEATTTTGYTDLFTYTSGSPKSMSVANAGPYTGTGDKGDYIVLFLKVDSTASQGAKAAETVTFSYDEI